MKYPSWPSIEALLTRVDLVDAIAPNRLGSDKSKWDPNVLTRSEAWEVVNAVFAVIVETLLQGETVDLPIGTFEVQKRTDTNSERPVTGDRVHAGRMDDR